MNYLNKTNKILKLTKINNKLINHFHHKLTKYRKKILLGLII